MKIVTDKGHFWITFDNGYTLSIFNGFGSYSDNHYNQKYHYPTSEKQMIEYMNKRIESTNCEIAIISPENNMITDDILQCGDCVKGYVDINELIEIINKVNKYVTPFQSTPIHTQKT